MHQLLQEQFQSQGLMRDDAADIAKSREADTMIDDIDEDVSEKGFTERLLDDPMLWIDHVVSAMGLESDHFCISLQAHLSVIHKADDDALRDICLKNFGNAIYKEVMAYAAKIEAES